MKKKLSLNEEIVDIIDEFTFFDDWSDKYQHLIDQGKKIERIEENLKVEKNKIKGCQSNVYFFSKTDDDGIIYFSGESDAAIVQGLMAILFRVFSGRNPNEILSSNADFLNKIGLDKHLSPTRKNGLSHIINAIYSEAKKQKVKQT